MLEPLEALFRLGRREGRAELERLGYDAPARAFAVEPSYEELGPHRDELERGLRRLAVKVDGELVAANFAGVSQSAIIGALNRVRGGRAIAAGLVSSGLTAGLAATFEDWDDAVDCWEYTAVLDGGTCEACAPLDGTRYPSLAALYVDLPGFGPNPRCFGGGRCRCRAVPCPKG